jgi:hypothetical protein
MNETLKWLDQGTPVFECPDLMERKGVVVITSWLWKPRETVLFGLVFSRFVPLETDLSDLENGGVRITGVSPDLPRHAGGRLKTYTCQFRFDEGRHWFDGFVELGAPKPLRI